MKQSAKSKKTVSHESTPSSSTPKEKVSPSRLYLTTFISGTMVMVLEMTGSRMLAPFLGTSIIVWTSLIGIVLASLSLGYWYGGILADKYPRTQVLARIIFSAAIFIAVVGFVYTSILTQLSSGRVNLYFSAIVSSIVLFAVPGILLGMVSPLVVRLAISDLDSSGAVVGRLYALSSVGSILGTFLGGFILISIMKTGTILLLIAVILIFAAVFVQGKQVRMPKLKLPGIAIPILPVLVPVLLLGAGWYQVYGDSLLPFGYHKETPYNHIRVYPVHGLGQKLVVLQTDPGGSASQSFMFEDRPNELYSSYLKYHELAFHFNPELRRVLLIGGGGYCLPKHLLTARKDVSVDVVEIDPGITEVAQKYFGLTKSMCSDPRLRIFHEDARQFLRSRVQNREDAEKYDIIFGDAFNSDYNIPFHLTTKEYMQEVYEQLSDEGVFFSNIISSVKGKKHKLFDGFHNALAEVFPQTAVFLVANPHDEAMVQNIVLVGFKKPVSLEVDENTPEMIKNLLEHRFSGESSKAIPPLSDDFAPVERYVLE